MAAVPRSPDPMGILGRQWCANPCASIHRGRATEATGSAGPGGAACGEKVQDEVNDASRSGRWALARSSSRASGSCTSCARPLRARDNPRS